MTETSWMKAPRTPVFKVGIHRAQRFLHSAWLLPMEAGYSRAIPLRFLPAFPPEAKLARVPAQAEGEAGLAFLHWICQGLDEAGRAQQRLLALADGSFDTLNVCADCLNEPSWRCAPLAIEACITCLRNAKGRDVPPGMVLAPHLWEWLHKHIS